MRRITGRCKQLYKVSEDGSFKCEIKLGSKKVLLLVNFFSVVLLSIPLVQ